MNRLLIVFVLVGLLVLYLLRSLWLPAIGRFLVIEDPLSPADAILSLAGDQRRPEQAAKLHQQGLAKWFLITNLPVDTQRAQDHYVRQVRDIALAEGVPEASILVVPGVGRSTYDEALNVRRFVELQGFDSLIVVTSPWHTRRSRMIFGDVFRGADVEISVQPLRDDGHAHAGYTYQPDEWWTDRLGRLPTGREYAKIAAYVLGIR
jgi:uncharacterized SAM-binding protein YcdF (DUF218 family)